MNKLEVRQAIMSGTPLLDVPEDEYLLVRGWLHDIAGESIDNGQHIYAVIALNEVKKLDLQTASVELPDACPSCDGNDVWFEGSERQQDCVRCNVVRLL